MPDYDKKAKNKRVKQEARERGAATDKLKAQQRQARKRAKYGVSGKPAPVTVVRADTGEVVATVSQARLRKQGHYHDQPISGPAKQSSAYGIVGDTFGVVPHGSPHALTINSRVRKRLFDGVRERADGDLNLAPEAG